MVTRRRAAPTQNAHSVPEAQGRYELRPPRPVNYKEDPSDDITSKDYPCESAVEGVDRTKRKMSSTNDSTYEDEWTTDDDESGYGGSSFVASDSDESMDSNGSYAPSHLTGDESTSDGFSEISFGSPYSSSVADSNCQASVLRGNLGIAVTRQREGSTDRSSCSSFSFVSDGYDISDSSSDEDLGFKLPMHRLKKQTSDTR